MRNLKRVSVTQNVSGLFTFMTLLQNTFVLDVTRTSKTSSSFCNRETSFKYGIFIFPSFNAMLKVLVSLLSVNWKYFVETVDNSGFFKKMFLLKLLTIFFLNDTFQKDIPCTVTLKCKRFYDISVKYQRQHKPSSRITRNYCHVFRWHITLPFLMLSVSFSMY